MTAKKKQKQARGGPGSHIRARISYLHRAASYLSTKVAQDLSENQSVHDRVRTETELEPVEVASKAEQLFKTPKEPRDTSPSMSGDSPNLGIHCRLLSHLRSVSLKGQVRLSREMKRTICKVCNTLLVPAATARIFTENKSKGAKKPWADVSVIECKVCGTQKRFPVGARRQPKKGERREKVPVVMNDATQATSEG